jgi:alpha-L-fucosidase 2
MELRYTAAAKEWTEALPIGNGRLGAMIFGGVEKELLQLNEDTLWSGSPKDWNNPRAKELLPEVRELLYEGRFLEADQLSRDMLGPIHNLFCRLAIYICNLIMAILRVLISGA